MTDYLPQDSGELSLWGETAVDAVEIEQLRGLKEADVLVVGAGYTGLSCALHLAEQGVSVILLEARCIGFGGSGRNAGLVNAGIWQNPLHVVKHLGEEAGDRFNKALCHSHNTVFDLIDHYQIDCQAQRCGTINIAHKASAMDYLQKRCEQLQNIGAAVRLVDGNVARSISGSDYYSHGGILDPGAGTVQPLSYTHGLARAALLHGVQIFQESPLLSLERDENHWLATSARGRVMADKVVVATNAYADQNSQNVDSSMVPVFIFQCATAALPTELADSIIPERQGMWDTQTLMTSTRVDEAGRLVMSSAGSLQGMNKSIRQNWMKRVRERLYPQTKNIPWAYHWTGQVGVTLDKILRIQLLAPGVFAPAGYNGRGIGAGTVIGKHLADSLISGNRNEFPFPVQALYREKHRKLRSLFYEYGTLALQLMDRR
ncbi:MAG: FAD-binding oxidoreductase [Gammaproteobacteria bacterium]|nr:FAD-binding oxidoreductase [Gammaproteobacteria bacterium]